MSPILVRDFLKISCRADLNLLVGRWLRPIELEELQHGYQLLLDAAEAGKCQRWLLDVHGDKIPTKWARTGW